MHKKVEIKNAAGTLSYDVEIEVHALIDGWRWECWCGGVRMAKGVSFDRLNEVLKTAIEAATQALA